MSKKKILLGSAIATIMFVGVATVFADQTNSATNIKPPKMATSTAGLKKDLKAKLDAAKKDIKNGKVDVKNTVKDLKTEAKGALETNRDQIAADIQSARDSFLKDLTAEKAQLKTATSTQKDQIRQEIQSQFNKMRQDITSQHIELQKANTSEVALTAKTIAADILGLKTDVQKKKGQAIQQYYQRAAALLDGRINKIDALTSIVEEKVVQLEASGENLTEDHTIIADTRAKIATAQTKIAALNDLALAAINSVVSSDSSSTATSTVTTATGEALKAGRKSADEAISEAYQSLLSVMKLVNPSATTPPLSATTTATTTNQ